MTGQELTVVIPCKNEGLGLAVCLHFLNIFGGLQGVRVIIADCSTDDTRAIVTRSTYSQLRIEWIDGGLPAVARARAAKLVETPYVLFLDADVLVQHPITVVYGADLTTRRFICNDGYAWVYSIFDVVQRISRYVSPFALGGYMLFRTDAYFALGGFDPRDRFAEDYHLSMKVARSRFAIESATVLTSGRRFRQKGIWYMARMMMKSWWHRHDDTFFQQDHNYWA